MRFEIFSAFAGFSREQRSQIAHPDTAKKFLADAKDNIDEALKNDAFLHGHRIQAMFKAVIIGLGNFKLISEEDSGDVWTSEDKLQIPDFRVVLENGEQILIEVKNFYQGNRPFEDFTLTEEYFAGLENYSSLTQTPVKMAVFWVRWRKWTLVPLDAFDSRGNRKVLRILNAFAANEMASLGDVNIGTRFPLSMFLRADDSSDRSIDNNGIANFKIGEVEFYSAGQQIEEPQEKEIAFFLMQFGHWEMEEPSAVIEGGELLGAECICVPPEDSGQGFEIVGSLADMYSEFFSWSTVQENAVVQIDAETVPGYLGNLIPKNYKSEVLPLWRFIQQPSDLETSAPVEAGEIIADGSRLD